MLDRTVGLKRIDEFWYDIFIPKLNYITAINSFIITMGIRLRPMYIPHIPGFYGVDASY